jgi:predicted GH43/DUF377 family glycosyl hydrolase
MAKSDSREKPARPRVRTPAYHVERLGVIMEPDPNDPNEVEGVLNPAGITAPDGTYYLYSRLVGAGNYSRIGIARLLRDPRGRPIGVERLGIALEPEASYELVGPGIGGCEDPRVSYVPNLKLYVMCYAALGPTGPHVAIAVSADAVSWTRRGLVDFVDQPGLFNRYADKDAILLPEPVVDPDGRPALALLHRPMYEEPGGPLPPPSGVEETRFSIWVSYCPLDQLSWGHTPGTPRFYGHSLVAAPRGRWEAYRIGGGTVPLGTDKGWFTFYHGVELLPGGGRCYRAGTLLLDKDDPRKVIARSEGPLFGPQSAEERVGVVGNVVFPTAVDVRDGGLDVFYGMADSRIGVAHVTAKQRAGQWPKFAYTSSKQVKAFLVSEEASLRRQARVLPGAI